MAEEFLAPQEIPEKLSDIKDRWYGLAQAGESLKDYQSGRDEGLLTTLEAMGQDISDIKGILKLINRSVKRDFPSARSQVEELTEDFESYLDGMGQRVRREAEVAGGYKRLTVGLSEATKMLEEAEKRFRDVESKTSGVCTKYFERESEYSHQAGLIRKAFDEKVGRIKEKFIGKVRDVCSGHEIFVAGAEMSVDDLFNAFVKNPSTADAVSLVKKEGKKGIFDSFTKKGDDVDINAKYEVLKYTCNEITSEVAPLKKEETTALVRLDSKFGDLRKLELECKDAEMRRAELQRPRDELKAEVKKLRNSEFLVMEKYDYILSVHDKFMENIKEIKPVFKDYMTRVEEVIGDYEVPERDVEKRELKEEIKRLKETRRTLEDEVIEMSKKLQKTIDERDMTRTELESVKKDLQDALEREGSLKDRMEEMEGIFEKVKDKMGEVTTILTERKGV